MQSSDRCHSTTKLGLKFDLEELDKLLHGPVDGSNAEVPPTTDYGETTNEASEVFEIEISNKHQELREVESNIACYSRNGGAQL